MAAPFKPLGSKLTREPKPRSARTVQARLTLAKSISYQRIEKEVTAAIAKLPPEQLTRVPLMSTLPEKIVALGLLWGGFIFRCQLAESGGRLRVGGAVVDFVVYEGSRKVMIRVQGDYWHSLPNRAFKDWVQWGRLHALGYRVWDCWEHDCYRAWVEERVVQFVTEGVRTAG